jgi:hypothetical protein
LMVLPALCDVCVVCVEEKAVVGWLAGREGICEGGHRGPTFYSSCIGRTTCPHSLPYNPPQGSGSSQNCWTLSLAPENSTTVCRCHPSHFHN